MTDNQLDKTFDPAAIEAKWFAQWEGSGLFRPHRPDAMPFTIVNPPPNVTGSLHIGHALDNTLQDVVVRYERLRGKDALWVVGTDHAGIATQMVVERQMEAAGDKRSNYSREAFVDKVWEWKHESGGTITQQLRRLGCSMDWSREQFTMDPHFTTAVVKVFVDLYNQGLIYRDKRLVNWDPKLKTAISDLEVEVREVKGHFWRFRYPLADGAKLDNGQDYIEVATTRPETMLADMAVAVNGDDPRYRSVIGKEVVLPITGRRIPIISDEHADPELGTGAVKITPGHDFNDFEVGKRAGIEPWRMLNMFDSDACVVQTSADDDIPDQFFSGPPEREEIENGVFIYHFPKGLDRFEARKLVVQMLKEQDLLVPFVDKDGIQHEAEPRTIQTPFGDRGGVVIEPWLTDQWYVNAAELAKAPIRAVREGAIEIIPKSWEKTWFNWMENIQPWCVSRQLWWGHRIPAWYTPMLSKGVPAFYAPGTVGRTIVAVDESEAIFEAENDFGADFEILIANSLQEAQRLTNEAADDRKVGRRQRLYLLRDEDVLDTWFSSALWPFATLGWPDAQKPLPLRGGVGVGAIDQTQRQPDSPHPPTPSPEGERESLLTRHYPNDLLISGFDILFFWCARMAMQGMHFNDGQVPWKRLYLHGLVRAADGQKMSKSKGNVVDPLGLIDQYGADALRFFMCAMESQGRDVKMDEKRVEGYRNFATKLWNAARFCQSNGITASTSPAAPVATLAVNKWIIGEVVETLAELDKAMADLRFDAAANAVYHFVWDQFCDWYIELIKPALSSQSPSPSGEGLGVGALDQAQLQQDKPHPPTPSPEEEGEETRRVAGWVLDQILVMLHPFMPFVTEELWNKLGVRDDYPLITASWPNPGASVDAEAKAEVEWLITLTGNLRTAKNELGLAPGAKLAAWLPEVSDVTRGIIDRNSAAVERVARLSAINFAAAPAGASMQIGAGDANLIIPLEGVIDIAAEKARLAKALEASTKEFKSLEGRLNNPAFVEKAKPEAVDKARADHAMHKAEAERLAAALGRLG